jgi:hypothetical protein
MQQYYKALLEFSAYIQTCYLLLTWKWILATGRKLPPNSEHKMMHKNGLCQTCCPSEDGCLLGGCSGAPCLSAVVITLMIQAGSTCEMAMNFYQTAQHKPVDSHLYTHCCQNPKSQVLLIYIKQI